MFSRNALLVAQEGKYRSPPEHRRATYKKNNNGNKWNSVGLIRHILLTLHQISITLFSHHRTSL